MLKYTIRKHKTYSGIYEIYAGSLPYKAGLLFPSKTLAQAYVNSLPIIITEAEQTKLNGRY